MKRAEHDKVKAIVAEQAQLFSEQVAEEFRKIMAEVGRDTEVVYVYGGGSGPVKQFLHPLLLELAPEGVPVLYLDARYSRHLNREGLLIAATMVEEQARAQEQVPASKQGRRAAAVAAA
jgi:plasmid segregation protein ParM